MLYIGVPVEKSVNSTPLGCEYALPSFFFLSSTLKLRDNMYVLADAGGNIVVLNGPEGKLLVDTFVSTGGTKLKQTLDGLSNAPLKVVIDTHWHLDHADNNGPLHDAG